MDRSEVEEVLGFHLRGESCVRRCMRRRGGTLRYLYRHDGGEFLLHRLEVIRILIVERGVEAALRGVEEVGRGVQRDGSNVRSV